MFFHKNILIMILIAVISLCSCTVGPNYVRPSVEVPTHFKEAGKNWKVAEPQDAVNKGEWWKIFHDSDLNALENQVDVSNQNIAVAFAQFEQSIALVREAEASFFPLVTTDFGAARQKQSTQSSSLGSASTISGSGLSRNGGTSNTFTWTNSASWTPDLWGSVRRQVESNKASAEASAAELSNVRLSMQATLAQDYFQLRTLDRNQDLLNKTVIDYKKSLQLTKRQYAAGTAALSDIAQATAQLKLAEVSAYDNGVNRATFEHAIAVLVGKPASSFSIKPKVLILKPPPIPIQLPCTLLERRPDVAQAERQMAAANASIGVAIAAYFPALPFSGTYGYQNNKLKNWLFKQPTLFWSIGIDLTETVLDGGLRRAQVAAARAVYQQNVANYRQVVLAAFQNVEDNLSTLRILKLEAAKQQEDVAANVLALQLLQSQYIAGTTAYTNVLVGQTNAYNAKLADSNIAGRRMVAAVGLIEALGGGWCVNCLKNIRWPTPLPF
jgi:NodT family efflux transporter outer membrane factor (OMF) lipoprotein